MFLTTGRRVCGLAEGIIRNEPRVFQGQSLPGLNESPPGIHMVKRQGRMMCCVPYVQLKLPDVGLSDDRLQVLSHSKMAQVQRQNPSSTQHLKIGLKVSPERSSHSRTQEGWTRDTAPSHQNPPPPQGKGPASTAPRA